MSSQLAKDEKEAKRRKKDKGLQFKAILEEMISFENDTVQMQAKNSDLVEENARLLEERSYLQTSLFLVIWKMRLA